MTNEDRLKFLDFVEEQAYESLNTVRAENFEPEKIKGTLSVLSEIEYLRSYIDRPDALFDNAVVGKSIITPDPVPDDCPFPVETAEKCAEVSEKSLEKCEARAEEPTMSREDLRGKLADLKSQHGVNVSAIIHDLGYARLNEVPAGKYEELLKLATEAAKESA